MRDSVDLFLAMNTQWRWLGVGLGGAIRLGLDYTALEPIGRLTGVELSPAVFNDLRIMEGEALSVFAKK